MRDGLLAGGVFVTHGLLDTVVSTVGVAQHGTHLEGNPLMKTVMDMDLLLFAVVKLVLVAIAAAGIYYCLQRAGHWGHKPYYQTATAAFILVGLLVVGSNMVMIA